MFTGLVEGVGELVGLTPVAGGLRLAVKTSFPAGELTLGESVAVAGACLTVVALAPPAASFEVSPETLAGTTFPLKKVGDRVNLERAVRLGDRLGGHLVTGHVDGVGVVREIRPGPAHTRMKFELPAALSRFVIEKGSIAVDGVSLTVNLCQGHTFTVNVIPHTAPGDHPGRPQGGGQGQPGDGYHRQVRGPAPGPGRPPGRRRHPGTVGQARVFVGEPSDA